MTNHLRWIRSHPENGEIALEKFVSSLKPLEECQIRFTSDGSKVVADAIHAFNQAEKQDYLL